MASDETSSGKMMAAPVASPGKMAGAEVRSTMIGDQKGGKSTGDGAQHGEALLNTKTQKVFLKLTGWWVTAEEFAAENCPEAGTGSNALEFKGAGYQACSFPGCIYREKHHGPHGFDEATLALPTPKRSAGVPSKFVSLPGETAGPARKGPPTQPARKAKRDPSPFAANKKRPASASVGSSASASAGASSDAGSSTAGTGLYFAPTAAVASSWAAAATAAAAGEGRWPAEDHQGQDHQGPASPRAADAKHGSSSSGGGGGGGGGVTSGGGGNGGSGGDVAAHATAQALPVLPQKPSSNKSNTVALQGRQALQWQAFQAKMQAGRQQPTASGSAAAAAVPPPPTAAAPPAPPAAAAAVNPSSSSDLAALSSSSEVMASPPAEKAAAEWNEAPKRNPLAEALARAKAKRAMAAEASAAAAAAAAAAAKSAAAAKTAAAAAAAAKTSVAHGAVTGFAAASGSASGQASRSPGTAAAQTVRSPVHAAPQKAASQKAAQAKAARAKAARAKAAEAEDSCDDTSSAGDGPTAAVGALRYSKVFTKLTAWWETPDTLRRNRIWALEGMCNFPGCPLADRHGGPHQYCKETIELFKA